MHKVTIKASGEVFEVDENTSLLEALRQKDVYVKSSCGGNGSCSDCIVKVVEGKDNINTPTFEELQLLGNVFHITKERLSCQTKMTGDITIDLSNHCKDSDEKRRKAKTANMMKRRQQGKDSMKTKVRKKEEVEKIHEERQQIRQERDQNDKKWEKHWEREDRDPRAPKRLGGGKRPTTFRTDTIDYDKVDSDRSIGERVKDKKHSDSKDFRGGKKPFDKKGGKKKFEGKSFNEGRKPFNDAKPSAESSADKSKRDFSKNRK